MTATLMAGREPGASDVSGKGRKFLTWLVDVAEPNFNDPLIHGMPGVGATYPFQLGNPPFPLVLDGYTTEPVAESPNTHTWATGAYTNDRSARLDPVEDTGQLSFKDWGWAIVEHTRTCPIVQVHPAFVDAATQDFRTYTYEDVSIPFVETELVMQRIVNVNTLTVTNALAIADANSTLFMIQGRPWLCKTAQNFPSLERGVTRVTYEFHSDRGTSFASYNFNTLDTGSAVYAFGGSPDPDIIHLSAGAPGPVTPYVIIPGAPSDKLVNVGLQGYSSQGFFLRSPFHELRVALRDEGRASFVQTCNYRVGTAAQLAGLPGGPFN